MKRVTERVPDDLRAFFRDVSSMIHSGDKMVRIPSDDLIQCDCAYGGLSDEDPDLFDFVYFGTTETTSK